jgi:DNA-binding response OmpR family regulator
MASEHLPAADPAEPRPIALLAEAGIDAILVLSEADVDAVPSNRTPQIALLDCSALGAPDVKSCLDRFSRIKLPVILLVPESRVRDLVDGDSMADFLVTPFRDPELVARAKRAVRKAGPPEDADVVRVGDLVINATSYEVSVNGKRVDLRFKEYELLRLLASSPGRVFTREALLSKIWGYDYFGGTRTVDVHIRRLRSKIEDAEHSFIETIWAVGYRFRDVRRPA